MWLDGDIGSIWIQINKDVDVFMFFDKLFHRILELYAKDFFILIIKIRVLPNNYQIVF